MKTEDKHKWIRQPDDEDKTKVWICSKCGCEKSLGYYKFAEPSYNRSMVNYDYRPDCVNMDRRCDDLLD